MRKYIYLSIIILFIVSNISSAQKMLMQRATTNAFRIFNAFDFFIEKNTQQSTSWNDQREFGRTITYRAVQNNLLLLRSSSHIILRNLTLPDSQQIDIEVKEFSIFCNDAAVIEAAKSGSIRRSIPYMSLYKGTVSDKKSSFVYLAIDQQSVSGSIHIDEKEYSINTIAKISVQQNEMLVQIAEVIPDAQQSLCGIFDENELSINSPSPVRKGVRVENVLRDTLLAKVGIDADYEAFQHYGGVTQTENYITARMGEASAIYERDMAIKLEISFLRVWSTQNDPYTGTSMSVCLSEFSNYWKANMDTVDRALAVFISRRQLDGQDDGVTSGLASLDALCNKTRGYAFDKFSKNNNFISGHTGVLAHEMGHVFGSRHTHNCWWNPPIDSCATAEEGTCFAGTKAANGEIMSYCGQKTNEFRERVAAYIRQRAEAASCLTITSQIRSLVLSSPDGGESWCAGTSQTIRWTSTGVTYVKIELSTNGGTTFTTTLIASTFSPPGSWTWNISASQATGNQYRIRVVDALVGSPVAVSNSNFEIKPVTLIQTHPLGTTLCEGQSVQLNVAASGAGNVTYQWKRNGIDLPGKINTSLQLSSVTKQDSGSYTVVVTGACGALTSNAASVVVNKGAVITQQPLSLIGCIGKSASMNIIASGDNLKFQWYKGIDQVNGATSATLYFWSVTSNDDGAYSCLISSPCGGAMSNIAYLTVASPSVSLMKPIGSEQYIAGDSLSIEWNALCIEKIIIEFSTDGGQTWTTIASDVDPAQASFKYKIPSAAVTDKALVKISDQSNGSLFSQSQNFIITKQTGVNDPAQQPVDFVLEQNYPNPFTGSTAIGYRLLASGNVRLEVFDFLGRKVATIVDEEQEAGVKQVEVKAKEKKLNNGIYFYQLESNRRMLRKKMIVLQ